MTREERIKSYQENIFNAILDPKGISKEDFEYLLDVIPTYLKMVLDIEEVQINYKDMENYGEYILGKNVINISKNYFQYKEDERDNVIILADLIQNCTHELYHALDDREKKYSGSKREHQTFRHEQGIKSLSHFFPEKKHKYEYFARAMYAITRSECFARKGAVLMLQNFVKDMQSFVITKFSGKNLGEQLEQIDKYIQQVQNTNNYENIPNVSPEAWALNNIITKCTIFKTKTQYEEEKENEIMKLAVAKRGMLPEIKEDLFKASEKVKCSWNQINELYDEKTLMYLATTQELADFYDERTLKNFEDYANLSIDKKGLNYVCMCAAREAAIRNIKNFDLTN